MLRAHVNSAKLKKISELLKNNPKKLKKEFSIAVNATAKIAKKDATDRIAGELATKKSSISKTITNPRKASASEPTAVVRVSKTKRIPLRDFGARQVGKGVSYKTSKSQGRKLAKSAFIPSQPGPKRDKKTGRFIKRTRQPMLGANVFKRQGKTRLPIVKLKGPSTWGVYKKKKMQPQTEKVVRRELTKQIDRRLRFLKLKKSGQLNWQKKK